jgi:hypothetical protein
MPMVAELPGLQSVGVPPQAAGNSAKPDLSNTSTRFLLRRLAS